MNLARLMAVGFLIAFSRRGRHHYRTLLNPVSALCLPLAGALVIEQAFLPTQPFGYHTALLLIGVAGVFAFGALAGPIGPIPLSMRVTIKGGWIGRRRVLFVAVAACLVVAVGGLFVKHVYNGAGVGQTRTGVFDRGLVIQAINGSTNDYIIRFIIAFVFPVAVLVAFYWQAKGRARAPIAVLFVGAIGLLSLGLRARLVSVLALVLIAILLLMSAGVRRIRSRIIPIAVLVPLIVLTLFNQVAHERYGTTGSGRNRFDFFYATAGGPSALSVAMSGEQPVHLLTNPEGHPRGQSLAGIVSALGIRGRGLGSYNPVYTGTDEASSINIYTGAWLLIWDLGVPMTLIVMALLGAAARMAHQHMVRARTAGSVLMLANLLFICCCFPVTLLSCYNLWWGIWLLVPVANRFFTVQMVMPAPRRVVLREYAEGPDAP